MRNRWFDSPYAAQGSALLMNLLKAPAKILIGMYVASPMLIGDGSHNIADIFEAVVVILVIFFARLPASDRYPLGRKNIESVFSVMVGGGLVLMAASVAYASADTLVKMFFGGSYTAVKVSMENAPWVMGVTLGSALLSILISRYQIRVGKLSGHEALVADGQETRSDANIELAAFTGICGEYLFHAPWIEYPFALLVSVLMFRTGREIFDRGWGALLKRSIGQRHDEAIIEIAQKFPGVVEIDQIKSFMTGNKVVLILKVLTRQSSRINRLLKKAIAVHIIEYLREEEFEDGEFFIRFDEPDPERFRRAVAVHVHQGREEITRELITADAVIICDIEHGAVVRATRHECSLPLDDSGDRARWFRDLLSEKRVVELVVFEGGTDITLADAPMLSEQGIEVVNASGRNLCIYGL